MVCAVLCCVQPHEALLPPGHRDFVLFALRNVIRLVFRGGCPRIPFLREPCGLFFGKGQAVFICQRDELFDLVDRAGRLVDVDDVPVLLHFGVEAFVDDEEIFLGYGDEPSAHAPPGDGHSPEEEVMLQTVGRDTQLIFLTCDKGKERV